MIVFKEIINIFKEIINIFKDTINIIIDVINIIKDRIVAIEVIINIIKDITIKTIIVISLISLFICLSVPALSEESEWEHIKYFGINNVFETSNIFETNSIFEAELLVDESTMMHRGKRITRKKNNSDSQSTPDTSFRHHNLIFGISSFNPQSEHLHDLLSIAYKPGIMPSGVLINYNYRYKTVPIRLGINAGYFSITDFDFSSSDQKTLKSVLDQWYIAPILKANYDLSKNFAVYADITAGIGLYDSEINEKKEKTRPVTRGSKFYYDEIEYDDVLVMNAGCGFGVEIIPADINWAIAIGCQQIFAEKVSIKIYERSTDGDYKITDLKTKPDYLSFYLALSINLK